MRVLFACGIYPPEIGGPATYAARLKDELKKHGHEVRVVTYASRAEEPESNIVRVIRGNKLLNRIRYFRAFWPEIRQADIVYLFDWFAAGLPAAIAARLARKPYIVRVGGDYLWEQKYLEGGEKPMSLASFYAHELHRKYPILFFLTRFVLSGAAHVVFNSDLQRALYDDHYNLRRTSTIYNPVPVVIKEALTSNRKKEFVFWGRFIVMKNVSSLVRAFARADLEGYTLALIGQGPRRPEIATLINELGMKDRITIEESLPNAQVLERVKASRAFVLPSWTDVAPNQVHEALAIGLPALVTEENYLAIRKQLPLTIDPHSVDGIAEKLRMLADDEVYERFSSAFRSIHFSNSWDDVTRAHEELFTRYV